MKTCKLDVLSSQARGLILEKGRQRFWLKYPDVTKAARRIHNKPAWKHDNWAHVDLFTSAFKQDGSKPTCLRLSLNNRISIWFDPSELDRLPVEGQLLSSRCRLTPRLGFNRENASGADQDVIYVESCADYVVKDLEPLFSEPLKVLSYRSLSFKGLLEIAQFRYGSEHSEHRICDHEASSNRKDYGVWLHVRIHTPPFKCCKQHEEQCKHQRLANGVFENFIPLLRD